MKSALLLLAAHWLAAALLLLALALALPALLRRRWRSVGPALGVGCAAFVAGGLLPPGDWGLWLALAAGLALVGLLVLLAFTGDWYPRPAAAAAVLLLLGLG